MRVVRRENVNGVITAENTNQDKIRNSQRDQKLEIAQVRIITL